MNPEPIVGPSPDELLEVELRVARRADQLARALPGERDAALQLDCWLRAEREVFGDAPLESASPA